MSAFHQGVGKCGIDKQTLTLIFQAKIRIYRKETAPKSNSLFNGQNVDQWLYSADELKKFRPELNFDTKEIADTKELISETTVNIFKLLDLVMRVPNSKVNFNFNLRYKFI